MSNLNQLHTQLSKIYYNESHPASFGGVKKLFDAVKSVPGASLANLKEWLSAQVTYTVHKPIRKRFQRNPTIVNGIDDQWQADLVDVKEFARQNNGNKYLITVIDIFSKYAFVFPTKSKTMSDVLAGFKQIFKVRKPIKLQTDQGKEFDNKLFRDFLKKENILYYTTRNTEIKCSIVERFNRTLRGRMFRFFTKQGTHKYIHVLDKLVSAYNKSVHSSIGIAPCRVNDSNSKQVFKRLYGFSSVRELLKAKYKAKPKLAVNDDVRIQNYQDAFSRGYHPTWTEETFKVSKAIKASNKPQYVIRDHKGETIEGRFYPEEVQKVSTNLYRIEKIIKSRTRNGVKEVFVKWLRYPDSDNSWIPESSVQDL